MSNELKPCPFCGCEGTFYEQERNGHGELCFGLVCVNCYAEGPRAYSRKDCEPKWNTRVADAENERLRGVIEGIRLLAKYANFTEASSTLDKIERRCREALEGTKDDG